MSELAVDIVLRTREVKAKLKSLGSDTQTFAEKMRQNFMEAAEGLNEVPNSLNKVNHAVRKSNVIWFQAGQAISDFAAAGVLGAANNIEFLAAQMGVGGPLLASVAVATTAFIVFSDEIGSALNPVGQRVKELKKGIDEIFDVLNKPGFNVGLLANQVVPAFEEAKAKVDALKGALNVLQFGIKATPEVQAVIDQLGTVGKVNAELAIQQAALDAIKGEYDSILNSARAQSGLLTNSFVMQNQEAGEEIRKRIIALGLAKELGDTSNLLLVKLERQGELEDFIKKLQEEKNHGKREELTLLERTQKTNERLKEQLEALQNVDQSRLGALIIQNEKLQEQIKNIKEQIKLRQFLAGIDLKPSPIVPVFQQKDVLLGGPNALGIGGLEQFIDKLEPLKIKTQDVSTTISKAAQQLGIDLNNISDSAFDSFSDIVNGSDRSAEAFDRAGIAAQDFYSKTEVGARALGSSIATLAGGIGSAFEAAYDAAGQKAGGFFVAFKAFSIAEATISAFVAANKALAELGPIAGPIAAAAIYAQAIGNVIAIASIKPGSGAGAGVSGGGSIGRTGSGFVDPRQGRTGRLQREDDVVNQFGFAPGRLRKGPVNIGYDPLAPMEVTVGGGFNLKLLGEDLVGSWEKTMQRQERTRGPKRDATRNSTGYRGGR